MGNRAFLLSITSLILILVGCTRDSVVGPNENGVDTPGVVADERVTITNNESDLDARVRYHDDRDVPVGEDGKAGKSAGFSMKLVAEVDPPVISGKVLQATSIDITGNVAVVGYAMVGEDFLGAVDVINIKNGEKPKLTSSAVFMDADVHSVTCFDERLFMAESTSDTSFASPSAFEVLTMEGNKLLLENHVRYDLSSYAATSVFSTETAVYITSGDEGGLEVFNPVTWTHSAMVAMHDARWVDVADGSVVVAQGTPGQISVYDEASLAHRGSYPVNGSSVAESKSTVQIVAGKAFVAAGPGGVQVHSVETGALLGAIPAPDHVSLGLDPSAVVTNALAVDRELLFIANGGAGLYVVQGTDDFAKIGSEVAVELAELGKLQFEDDPSVNHVAFKKNHLIVAAGLGGLKIVSVK